MYYFDFMNKIKNTINILDNLLPLFIKEIAIKYNVSQFQDNPDFLEERLIKWHQFGLLTHTKEVRKAFYNEAPRLLKSWGLHNKLIKNLNQKISEFNKYELFDISITFHDLGKIICHNNLSTNRNHEKESANLIGYFEKKLSELGLSNYSLDYLKRCIETHDIIGKEIRDKITEKNNFSFRYLSNKKTKYLCQEIIQKYPDIKFETGLYFLCDSLGKTDIRINAKNDKELAKAENLIIGIIKQRNLNPQIIQAAIQLPLNIKLAEIYLNGL